MIRQKEGGRGVQRASALSEKRTDFRQSDRRALRALSCAMEAQQVHAISRSASEGGAIIAAVFARHVEEVDVHFVGRHVELVEELRDFCRHPFVVFEVDSPCSIT